MFLIGTRFSAAKLPFINRDIYALLPGGFKPFWNESGFNPNLAGGVLALFWPLAFMLAVAGESWLQRLLALFTVIILSTMVLLRSYAARLSAVALAVPIMTILYDRRWLWGWLAILVAGGVYLFTRDSGVSLKALWPGQRIRRLKPAGARQLWSRALYMIQDFWFTGVGLGMFQRVVQLLYPTFIIGPDVVLIMRTTSTCRRPPKWASQG